mmetsp:Transcript_20176/g.64988  ORF Transcript_20176/g.64988 Transcript_20176/m.64988 type:complete len:319 (+) Transcript_20176:394-1350(+)
MKGVPVILVEARGEGRRRGGEGGGFRGAVGMPGIGRSKEDDVAPFVRDVGNPREGLTDSRFEDVQGGVGADVRDEERRATRRAVLFEPREALVRCFVDRQQVVSYVLQGETTRGVEGQRLRELARPGAGESLELLLFWLRRRLLFFRGGDDVEEVRERLGVRIGDGIADEEDSSEAEAFGRLAGESPSATGCQQVVAGGFIAPSRPGSRRLVPFDVARALRGDNVVDRGVLRGDPLPSDARVAPQPQPQRPDDVEDGPGDDAQAAVVRMDRVKGRVQVCEGPVVAFLSSDEGSRQVDEGEAVFFGHVAQKVRDALVQY